MRMGFAYYGYGFFLSALVTLIVAYVLAANVEDGIVTAAASSSTRHLINH